MAITFQKGEYEYNIEKRKENWYQISIIKNHYVLCVFDYFIKNNKPKIKCYPQQAKLISEHISSIQKYIEFLDGGK